MPNTLTRESQRKIDGVLEAVDARRRFEVELAVTALVRQLAATREALRWALAHVPKDADRPEHRQFHERAIAILGGT